MTTAEIITELLRTRAEVEQVEVPAQAGVYAVFTKDPDALPLEGIPAGGLIYIGMSTDLFERQHNTHFDNAKTGWSTLRRSLGALLKDQLNLFCVQRRLGKSEKDFSHYRFVEDGEKRLTEWMLRNLEIGYCILPEDSKDTEKSLIVELQPVLCLLDWQNPYEDLLKSARKRCADEARATHRRG